MQKKNVVGLTVSLALCALILGGSALAQQAAKKKIKIAMIGKSSTNPVFLSARSGAEAAAKDLFAKYNIKVTIDWRTPPTEDGQIQAQRLAQAVNEGADAVLIILIRQSIRTLHLDQNYEWIIIGCAIIVAVVLDRLNARLTAKRMLRIDDRRPMTDNSDKKGLRHR